MLNVKTENFDKTVSNYVNEVLPVLEKNNTGKNILDEKISINEIIKSTKQLKSGKAAGLDRVCNEMLKCSLPHFGPALVKIFNSMLESGKFPTQWKSSILVPIHKKGDKCNPSNYRGIAISSCISKVFIRILNSRINNMMTREGRWSLNQNGFKADCRTEDNLFILNILLEKYKSCQKNVYLAFVDFSKYFDSISRNLLLYKLIKNGIRGNM